MLKSFTGLGLLFAIAACTSKDGASTTDGGPDALADAPHTCTSNTDCPEKGTACGFYIGDGCAAVGQCINVIGGATGCAINTTVFWCGCDGKTFPVPCDGYPYRFSPVPVAHTGACAGDPVPAEAGADGHVPTCEQVPDTVEACPVDGRKLYYCEPGANDPTSDCQGTGIGGYECCR